MTSPDSPARVLFDPQEMETSAFYRVLNSVVVPRPIAWVCSRSADGVLNLAPHSFYTVACVDPPVVQFTSVGRKDSLRNVEATGEFTVSLTPEALFEQINATGTDFPPGTARPRLAASGWSRASASASPGSRSRRSPWSAPCTPPSASATAPSSSAGCS